MELSPLAGLQSVTFDSCGHARIVSGGTFSVCVRVCVRERQGERERVRARNVCVSVCAPALVSVCV